MTFWIRGARVPLGVDSKSMLKEDEKSLILMLLNKERGRLAEWVQRAGSHTKAEKANLRVLQVDELIQKVKML